MTLIDSLSTLAVLGNSSEFQKQVRWLIENVSPLTVTWSSTKPIGPSLPFDFADQSAGWPVSAENGEVYSRQGRSGVEVWL